MEEKMNKKIEYFVRTMCLADNDEVNEVCVKAGMFISNHSNITMMKIDPNCLQVAEDVNTGKILGVCVGFIISPKLAFIGEYAVDPSFQRQGIGQSLWKKAMEHCGNRNISLFAAPKMISVYRERCGFKVIPARKMMVYSGRPHLFNINKYLVDCDMEWITNENVIDVIEYDESICGMNRAQLLQLSINEPGSVSLLARYIDSGTVAGYGIFRTTNFNTVTPRPLYADNDNIAEALIYNCLNKFVAYDGVHFEAWDVNDGANWIAEKLGLKLSHQSPIMFTREDVAPNNFKNIYYITSSDFYPF